MRAQDHHAAGTSGSRRRARDEGAVAVPSHSAAPLSPQTILNLQRTVGNAAVADLEAQRREAHSHGEGCGHDQPVQRSAVPDVLKSPGRPLDEGSRQEMESRLGADFSGVRLHTDTAARRSAAEIGARAYTSGEHVVIGDGGGDKHTLAHELTHVIQQRQGPVAGADNGAGLSVSDPSDRFEREAEAVATEVMRAPARHAGASPMTAEPTGGTTAGAPVQRTVSGTAGRLTDTADLFDMLGTAPADQWEVAAAQSLIDDHVDHRITGNTAAAVDKIRKSLVERVKLAKAIISIAHNGILTREDRERENIQAQQSIDPENATGASKISLSQSETGPDNSAEQVAGLLEHQAMSVRMEKYVEEDGRQVPEKWLDYRSVKPADVAKAVTEGLEMSMEEWKEVQHLPKAQNALYQEVMKARGKNNPPLAKLLAERASNSAIFGGSTGGAVAPDAREAFKTMGLDSHKEGSHEVRTSRSMPASALEFILLPRCLIAFDDLLREHIGGLTLHYVEGTHTVEVSWAPMVGMPQVRFEIESPNWKQKLQEILEKEERIFAHVTRPLK